MRKAVVMLLMLWLAAGHPLAGSLYAQQSLADLSDFMARVDDVTYADAGGGALTLAGRKIKSRAYGRIGVEEVAAVWQAQSAVNDESKRLKAMRKQLFDGLDAAGKRLVNESTSRATGSSRTSAPTAPASS